METYEKYRIIEGGIQMKKRQIGVMSLVMVLLLGFSIVYAKANAGSQDDPLVTKSYVDTVMSFKPLELAKGQSVYGGEGCEIIVRGGFVTVIAPKDGVADITAGKDLAQGFLAPTNHLLVISREDGRGVKAQETSWILVRGKYSVQ